MLCQHSGFCVWKGARGIHRHSVSFISRYVVKVSIPPVFCVLKAKCVSCLSCILSFKVLRCPPSVGPWHQRAPYQQFPTPCVGTSSYPSILLLSQHSHKRLHNSLCLCPVYSFQCLSKCVPPGFQCPFWFSASFRMCPIHRFVALFCSRAVSELI